MLYVYFLISILSNHHGFLITPETLIIGSFWLFMDRFHTAGMDNQEYTVF
jgi:hypothetical protein